MIIPVGFTQVNMKFTGAAMPLGAEVTWGFSNATAITPSGIAAIIAANWTTHLKAVQLASVSLSSILVKNGPNATGPSALVAGPGAGSISGNSLGPAASILVRKVTTLGGRHGRGRFYWPGLGEGTANDAGVINSGDITAYNTAWAGFGAACVADDLLPYLLHADATAPTAIVGFSTQSQMANQRRRNRK